MKRLLAAFLATSTLGLGGAAYAQAADDTQGTAPRTTASGFESVTVTARKRAEDEQAVPISITALSQSDLDKLNVRTIEDLKYVSPSVYIAPTSFRQDTLNITIRGQRNFDAPSGGGNPGLAFDTASAVYKDGVYYARAVGLGGSLFDLENVQVLKGPQGTLVGRNSTGGAILYQSREPGSEFGGFAQASVGDYARFGLQGAINLPLTDTLFLRVALNSENQKGYIANIFQDPTTGRRNTQAAMGTKKLGGVFSLKWAPDDTFNLLLRADVASEHDTGSTYHDLGTFVGTVASSGRTSVCNIPATCVGFTDLRGQVIQPYYLTATATSVSNPNPSPLAYNSLLQSVAREQQSGFWSADQDVSSLSQGHYETYSATANKSIGDIDIRAMAAYRTFTNTGTAVSRGQPFEANTYVYNFPYYHSYQSELTVNGKSFAGKLNWTTGLFWFNEKSPNDGGQLYLFLPSAGSAPTAAGGKQLTVTDWSHNSEQNSSYAAYAQATYSITPDTRFTAGVRYTYDERYAHIATQTIITPATSGTPTSTNDVLIKAGKPAVFNSGGFTFENQTYSGFSTLCGLANPGGFILPQSQCPQDIYKSYHKPTWTLALDHDLWNGTLVYATMRSGYRSGGINTQAINTSILTAAPEQVLDYELGVKSDWQLAGVPLRTNLAAYQTVYHNIQVLQPLINATLATGPGGVACTQALLNAGSCTGTANDNITFNAKSARIYGVEWDITALPTDWLTLNASGSYIDPRYTDFTVPVPAGYLAPSNSLNLTGTPIPVPAWQTNETATINFGNDLAGLPLGDTLFTAHYYWQSRFLADMRNYDPSQRTFAYGLLNIRAEFTDIGHSKADLALWINNLANTQACLPEYTGVLNSAPNGTFGTPNTSGVLQCIPLPPRMTGLTLGYKF